MFMTVRMNLWAASAPWYRTMSASATTRVSTVCSFVSWMAFLRSRQSRDGLPLRGFFFSRKRQRHPCRPWHFDFQNHTAKRPSAKPPVENGQSPMARSWTSTITGQWGGELRGRRGLTPVHIAAEEANGTEYQERENLAHQRRADRGTKLAEGKEAQARGRGGEIRKPQVNGREPASFLKGLYLLLTAGTRGGSTLAAVLTVTNKEP